jgi:hypothetical protein
MKLNTITLAVTALVLACAPACVQAQTTNTMSTTSSSTTTAAPSMKKIEYKGTVTAVDASANTITVQNSKATTMTLTITPDTKFRGGASLSDFAVGDKVSGSYMKDSMGMMTAASLHKKGMKKAMTSTSSTTSSSTTTAPAQ